MKSLNISSLTVILQVVYYFAEDVSIVIDLYLSGTVKDDVVVLPYKLR